MSNDLRLQVLLELKNKALAPLKDLAKGNEKLVAGLATTQAQLDKLAGQHAAIEQFRKLQTNLGETSAKLTAVRSRLVELRAAKTDDAAAQKAHNAEIKSGEKLLAKLEVRQDSHRRQLQRTRTALEKLGVTNVARAEAMLATNIDRATGAAKRQQAALERLQKAREKHTKTLTRAGMIGATGVGMAMAGHRLGRGVGTVLGAYSEQENASSDLRSAMMLQGGQVAPEFAQMDALAKKLGDRLPGTTADFVNMFTMLRRQGISAQAVLGGTGEAAAYLGVQLRMPVTEAAEFAAKMQDATRTTERDMMALMDVIQRTFYLGVDSGNMLQGF
ncbi:phage tail tape measure protein, partial [Ottowia sp.]|uniref:phage tail tape measure protein n=1 Tax=Ottowia sp. TaxID=1898956 RepID=UPI003A8675F1